MFGSLIHGFYIVLIVKIHVLILVFETLEMEKHEEVFMWYNLVGLSDGSSLTSIWSALREDLEKLEVGFYSTIRGELYYPFRVW